MKNQAYKSRWTPVLTGAVALSLFGAVGGATMASAAETGTGSSIVESVQLAVENVGQAAREQNVYIGASLRVTRDGVVVRHLVEGGPADTAGISEGDQVLSVNGVELGERGAMRTAMEGLEPGDTIAVKISNDSGTNTVNVTAGDPADRPEPPAVEDRPYLGAHPERPQINADGADEGVVLGVIDEGSPAAEAGLLEGDIVVSVNGVNVEDPRDAFDVIRALAPGDTARVTIIRGDDAQTIIVTLGSQADAPERPALGDRAGAGNGERPDRPMRGGGQGAGFQGGAAEADQA